MDQKQTTQTLEDIQLKIANTLGFNDPADQKKMEMVDKATEILLKRIFLDTIEKLTDDDAESYAKLIEAESSPEDIQKFLSGKIPDYNNQLQKTINDFMSEMKDATQVNP